MTTPLSTEELDLVYRAVRQATRPMNASNLKKALPISEPKLKELLKALVETGRIRIHRAKSPVYWTDALEEQAAERIVAALEDLPLTKTELEDKFKSLLVSWPVKKREEFVARLLKEKRVFKARSLDGKQFVYSTREALTTQDYVKLALHLAQTKLAKKKISTDVFYAEALRWIQAETGVDAPAEPEAPQAAPAPAELILEAMKRLSPAATSGELISITKLREEMREQITEKKKFDEMLLALAQSGMFVLHKYDFPTNLSDEAKEALVQDQHGNYYVGIAIRE